MAGFLQSSRRQEALLDPHDRIRTSIQRVAEVRLRGDQLLHQLIVGRDIPTVASFDTYLRTASSDTRLPVSPPLPAVDDELRQRFAVALRDEQSQEPTHPLYAWHQLRSDEPASTFIQHRRQIAAKLARQQQSYEEKLSELLPLADFRKQTFDDWFVTGWAFGDRPLPAGRWNGPDVTARITSHQVAHSGRFGRKARGVLRSPTFTLEHEYIHYRIKAEDVEIRLIIDGYAMGVYHSLLFADATLKDVNTHGQFRWVTQHRDLNHYQGHRAYLEIIDPGEGYVELEGVYFSDSAIRNFFFFFFCHSTWLDLRIAKAGRYPVWILCCPLCRCRAAFPSGRWPLVRQARRMPPSSPCGSSPTMNQRCATSCNGFMTPKRNQSWEIRYCERDRRAGQHDRCVGERTVGADVRFGRAADGLPCSCFVAG